MREREVRLGAEDYADEVLCTLEVNLGKFLQAVQRGRERLQGRDEGVGGRGGGGGEPFGAEPPCRTDGRGAGHARPALPAPRAGGGGLPAPARAARSPCAWAVWTTAWSPRSRRSSLTVTRSLSGLHLRIDMAVDLVGPCWRCLADARVHLEVAVGRVLRRRPQPGCALRRGSRLGLRPRAHPRPGGVDARRRGRGGTRHAPVPRGLRGPVPAVRRRSQRGPLRLRRRRSTTRAGTA